MDIEIFLFTDFDMSDKVYIQVQGDKQNEHGRDQSKTGRIPGTYKRAERAAAPDFTGNPFVRARGRNIYFGIGWRGKWIRF